MNNVVLFLACLKFISFFLRVFWVVRRHCKDTSNNVNSRWSVEVRGDSFSEQSTTHGSSPVVKEVRGDFVSVESINQGKQGWRNNNESNLYSSEAAALGYDFYPKSYKAVTVGTN
ncbi:hypothetical protein QQP08_027642 [Theobroma cacao]|nr:hypothetical protein QQP08_027642 [Theobroma cacao]